MYNIIIINFFSFKCIYTIYKIHSDLLNKYVHGIILDCIQKCDIFFDPEHYDINYALFFLLSNCKHDCSICREKTF